LHEEAEKTVMVDSRFLFFLGGSADSGARIRKESSTHQEGETE
jgi:hypothetical protein